MATTTEPLGDAQLQELAHRYRLNLDVASTAGTTGVMAGRETGASVEIQDFRDYVPGDDLRRIDWMAYGRTDRLVVRLFREEVSPFFDVLVDTSASMGIPDGRKAALVAELSRWLYHAARAEGLAVRLYGAGRDLRRVETPEELIFDQPESVLFGAPARAAAALRRSSVRLLLSDFLDPAEPLAVLRSFAVGCSELIVVQLLGPWERDPAAEGPAMLDAVELGRRADIHLDLRAVESYRRRLNGLRAALREAVFKCGGHLLEVVADRELETVLREEFLPAGLVEVY